MRDIIVIALVFALVFGAYYGYKHFFGEKVEMPVVEAADEQPAPKPEPKAKSDENQEDPVSRAELRVLSGTSRDEAADMFLVASNAARNGDAVKALNYYQRIYSDHAEGPYAAKAASKLAEHELAQGRKWEARNLYSFAYERTCDLKVRKSCAVRMDELNATLVFGPANSKDSVIYQAQPGDYLSKIAARFNCPYRLIMKINNIPDPRKLRAGQRVKVLVGPDGGLMQMTVIVDKSEFRLTAYLNGHYLKEYAVGIGQYDFTPSGEFTVGERIEKPSYRKWSHGHPKNILGDYWLSLDSEIHPGIGIHGTTEPGSISKKSSLGCIRMRNKDVRELFVMIPKGAKVIIQE